MAMCYNVLRQFRDAPDITAPYVLREPLARNAGLPGLAFRQTLKGRTEALRPCNAPACPDKRSASVLPGRIQPAACSARVWSTISQHRSNQDPEPKTMRFAT